MRKLCFSLASFSLVLCRVYFLSPCQLLWRSGRLQFFNTHKQWTRRQPIRGKEPTSSSSYWFRPRYDPTMSAFGHRRTEMMRRKCMFSPGQRRVHQCDLEKRLVAPLNILVSCATKLVALWSPVYSSCHLLFTAQAVTVVAKLFFSIRL